MKLFVAEKPDVGRELAAYLGKKHGATPKKSQRYLEVGGDVVTWARGHLLGLAEPDRYFPNNGFQKGKNGKYSWRDVPLPILPETFINVPSDDTDRKQQLQEIGRLMRSADEIYNASDRDREGQLIFDEILAHFKIKGKPVRRLIFSALDEPSFDKAFAEVLDNNDPSVRNKGLAAMMRSQADWLIGMNATRAMTLSHGSRETGVINVGRVMTPTISIVVRRQKEIDAFVPSPIWTPVITLDDGQVLVWNKRLGDKDQPGIVDGKIVDKALAEKIMADIKNGLTGKVTEARATEKAEPPPLPFSLPVIQSELSRKYGLTVDEITKACQALYERGMQTYLGTDCRYLPESMHAKAVEVLHGLSDRFRSMAQNADTSLKYSCWDDKKLTGEGAAAHYAIVPTGTGGPLNSEAERLVYESVCRRYMAQFYPEYKYLSIALASQYGKDEFKTTATLSLSPGWRTIDDDGSSNGPKDESDQRDRERAHESFVTN